MWVHLATKISRCVHFLILTHPYPYCIHCTTGALTAGWSIILAFTFTFGILSGQIGFVSLAPVTKYVLIVCYDNQIGNSLIEINTKIVFKFRSIITKFADPFCHSSTLLLIGRQRSRDLFSNPFLAFYWHIFYVFSFFNIRYLELV